MNQGKYIWLIPIIILIPIVGYGIMHGSVYFFSLSKGNLLTQLLYTLLIIALGLAIPYWVLKLSMHKAHLSNPAEKEIKLDNIPKDQKIPKVNK